MRHFIILSCAIFLLLAGCSGGGKHPVTPGVSSTPDSLDSLPMIGLSESGGSSNAIGLLGAYELTLNTKDMTAELVSKRFPTVGQSFIVSGKSFFAMLPCTNCMKISGIALGTDGNIELKFTLKHPFGLGDPHKPPSGSNRNDLNIFDTALVIKPIGITPQSFSLMKSSIYNGICVNPQGYTREMEGYVGDATACPYFLVVDDSKTNSMTYNGFSQSSTKMFSAFFNPNGMAGNLTFDLYLTFGYGISAILADRLHPTYFNPEFNRKSAWKVEATPPNGLQVPKLGNTWQENDPDTPYKVKVKVWDWQEGIESVANPPVNPGDVAIHSAVTSVTVEIPGMCGTLQEVNIPVRGTGSNPRDPLVYEIPIKNENTLAPGQYLGIVKVTDERVPQPFQYAGQIDTFIDSPDGIAFNWYTLPEFATYTTFNATVVEEPCLASGQLTDPDTDEYTVTANEPSDFTVMVTPSGHNVMKKYWVDWGTGNYTESNDTGLFNHIFADSGCPAQASEVYMVKFGAELDCTDGGILPIDSIKIKTSCAPCNATGSIVTPTVSRLDLMNGESVDFTLTANPVGGNIAAYWADWGTGTYTESSTTPNFSHQFTDPDNCPPFGDPPPAVGNVSIAVNRVYAGTGVVIDPNKPFNVSWTSPGGNTPTASYTVKFGVEVDCWPGNINNIGTITVNIKSCYDYVIKRDIDPDDGLSNNFEDVATTKSISWVAPPEHLNVDGSHYVKGATYVVYSRNSQGQMSAQPSEPAHIIISGAESGTDQTFYNYEGWTAHNRSNNTSSYRNMPFATTLYPGAGTKSIRIGDQIGQAPVGTWEGISRLTPTVPNSSVRFLEFSAFKLRPG